MQKAEGGAPPGAELRKRFGLRLADLRRWRHEYWIVYWQGAKGTFFYPKWQFIDMGTILPGIQEVLQMFQSRDQWHVMRCFLGERYYLGERRPLDLLRAGEIEIYNQERLHRSHRSLGLQPPTQFAINQREQGSGSSWATPAFHRNLEWKQNNKLNPPETVSPKAA